MIATLAAPLTAPLLKGATGMADDKTTTTRKPRTPEQRAAMKAYQKAWREENKERLSEEAKAYYAKNMNRWRERRDADLDAYRKRKADNARRFRAKNAAKVKAAKRRYYENNKDAVLAKAHAWGEKNQDKVRAAGRAYAKKYPERHKSALLKHLYGISLADFNGLADAQGRKCAICSKQKKLVVDHCHYGGGVRGLLCQGCNSAIGKLGDTADTVARAVAYLKAAEQRRAVERAS